MGHPLRHVEDDDRRHCDEQHDAQISFLKLAARQMTHQGHRQKDHEHARDEGRVEHAIGAAARPDKKDQRCCRRDQKSGAEHRQRRLAWQKEQARQDGQHVEHKYPDHPGANDLRGLLEGTVAKGPHQRRAQADVARPARKQALDVVWSGRIALGGHA